VAEAYLLGRRRTLLVFAGLMLAMLLAALNPTIVPAGGIPSGGADDLTLGSFLGGAPAAALHPVFLIGLPPMLVSFAATLLVEGRELQTSVHEPGEAGRELFDELGDEFRETSPLAAGGQR
jgi:hypothetical protein